jgi:putative transposase
MTPGAHTASTRVGYGELFPVGASNAKLRIRCLIRSIQLHCDNLRALFGEQQVPSYSTVRRFMASQGLHKQRRVEARRQFAPREVRSFEVEHVNSCWHLDFHTGSRSVLTAKGPGKTVSVMHSRRPLSADLPCTVVRSTSETARTLVHGFCQAMMRCALPRSLLTDNGAAMMAEEFQTG